MLSLTSFMKCKREFPMHLRAVLLFKYLQQFTIDFKTFIGVCKCTRVCSSAVGSWIVWRQSDQRRGGRNVFEKKSHVVLVQYRNSALTRPETIAVFEKQRLNSDLKTALCLYRDQMFYSVLNGINLSKAIVTRDLHRCK